MLHQISGQAHDQTNHSLRFQPLFNAAESVSAVLRRCCVPGNLSRTENRLIALSQY